VYTPAVQLAIMHAHAAVQWCVRRRAVHADAGGRCGARLFASSTTRMAIRRRWSMVRKLPCSRLLLNTICTQGEASGWAEPQQADAAVLCCAAPAL
jgi:hypothetical protein